MRTSVKFKVLNDVKVDQNWPVKIGKRTFSLETDGLSLKHIVCSIDNQPIEFAPILVKGSQGGLPTIHANSLWVKFVEQDLKSWQAVLCAYIDIDIDFQNYEMEFFPENEEEEKIDIITPFKIGQVKNISAEPYEFTTLGRAFLALDHGQELSSVMTFYREGKSDLFGDRFVSAYNNYFLFLESLFCKGKTKTSSAAEKLLSDTNFSNALDKAVNNLKEESKISRPSDQRSFIPKELSYNSSKRELTESIVSLRGKLRHHNKHSSVKWDPTNQEKYKNEAYFLATIVQEIAFEMGTSHLWTDEVAERFQKMSKKMGVELKVRVSMELIAGDETFSRLLDLSIPSLGLSAKLATFVLGNALELAAENDPHASILSIRAYRLPNGPELFRYDLGAQIARGKPP